MPVSLWSFNLEILWTILYSGDLILQPLFSFYFSSELKYFLSVNSLSTDNPSLLWETCKVFARGLIILSKKSQKMVNQRALEAQLLFQEKMYNRQWWSVTKYNYFVTVLKYIFQVSVLYWSSFILSNFYFYFTTFQSIRSYFLLHYIS